MVVIALLLLLLLAVVVVVALRQSQKGSQGHPLRVLCLGLLGAVKLH